MANENIKVLSDEYLLEGCRKRDNRCREAVYNKYATDLYQYALRYASNEEEAEDVLQESFLVIFDRIGQLREVEKLLPWMRSIVIREALKQYRKSLKRWQREIPLEENMLESETAPLPYHETDYRTLLQLIQKLPEGYRMVFNLCEIEGYDYEEAAKMMDCAPVTCRSQLSRAKSKLRQMIQALEKT